MDEEEEIELTGPDLLEQMALNCECPGEEIMRLRARVEELVESEEKAWQTVAKLRVELETTARLRRRVAELESEASETYEPQIAGLQGRAVTAEARVADLERNVGVLVNEVEGLKALHGAAEEELVQSKARVEGLQGDNGALRARIGELEGDLHQSTTRVAELESPQIGIVDCPECDYEFDFQVSSRASEE